MLRDVESRAGDGPAPGNDGSPADLKHIVVGLSGGVDSGVAALLLKERGYAVRALFMKNWEEDDTPLHCAAADDLAEAERVCDRLGIRLDTVNLSSEYWERVFSHFLAEYAKARTPNPDVLCNREIKFSAFLDHARSLGAERIATGHYARLGRDGGGYHLLKGADPAKDQSYFLHRVTQQQLSSSLFPLGELHKSDVRAMAARAGLSNYQRKDSTGLCFVGERPFRTFLARFLAPVPGDVESAEGECLGRHDGLMFYTIGQRQGLGLGGRRGGGGEPWYVIERDPARNVLVVAQGRHHPRLYRTALEATDMHWITEPPALPLTCHGKIRYRQEDQACRIEALEPYRYRITFDAPQWAVAAGQSVVLYRGDECLGGGVIAE